MGECEIPIVATALDYGWFCTRTTLVQSQGHLCEGQPNTSKCSNCLRGGRTWQVKLARQLASVLPYQGVSIPVLGEAVREAQTNRNRLSHTLSDWSIYRQAISRWIAPSKQMAHILVEHGIPQEKIKRIPYGYEIPLQISRKIDKEKIVFAYAGRPIYEKGFHLLLKAFKEASLDCPNIRLRLFGVPQSSNNAYIKQQLSTLRSIEQLVEFDSYDGKDVVSIQAAHAKINAMVVPSIWYDNLPLVVIESLANGTPVIASKHSSAADPVEHNRNGLLFDAFTDGDLTRTLIDFAKNSNLRQELYQYTHYAVSTMMEAQKLFEIYQEVALIK